MLDFKRVLAAKPRKHEASKKLSLTTPWGDAIDPTAVLSEHPTPQFARERWQSLNGYWEYAITQDGEAIAGNEPDAVLRNEPPAFDGRILVPFSPEAPLSGVGHIVQPSETLWYRRSFSVPALSSGERLLLHFQAVDYQCACFVNGRFVGSHEGGYLPFCFDITGALAFDGEGDARQQASVVLRVTDPSDTGSQLRGKQKLAPSDIWYTAQSGIWQTVWYEIVPAVRVEALRIDTDPKREGIAVHARVTARGTLHVEAYDADGLLVGAADAGTDVEGAHAIDAFVTVNDLHLWSPDDPYLYTLHFTFTGETAREGDQAEAAPIDQVTSYAAFRTCEVRADAAGTPRFFLNGEPLLLKGVLDQGYWPDGLMTAPADDALIFDIQSAKDLGFNMMRKHIKVESERWYYHCDCLGMLVWQDMVSGGGTYGKWYTSQLPTLFRFLWTRLSDEGPTRYAHFAAEDPVYRDEWKQTCAGTIETLRNHPCIVTWVLFNEAWGQFDARAMTDMVRKLDPSRPIDSTSGWYDQGAGDFFSVHNYFRELSVLPDPSRRGYRGEAAASRAFATSEFGGLTWYIPGHSICETAYGYDSYGTPSEWFAALTEQLATMEVLEARGLAAYVYTQLSDIEEETNGLLTYDRRINKMHEALKALERRAER